MKLLISGYSGEETSSIQGVDVTTKKAVFSRYEKNCSFLCANEDVVFGITEDEPNSEIYLYSLNSEGLTLLDRRSIEGGLLCHISFIKKNSLLVGACYGRGTIFSVQVDMENKQFSSEICYCTQGETQGKSHCVTPCDDETILYSANIMQDRVYRYHIEKNGLSLIDFVQLPLGIGPRHILTISKHAYYVITEYSNEVLLIRDSVVCEKYSTVADGFCGKSFGSTICLTKDKRFLYVANRGEDTVAVFRIHLDFSLSHVGRFACGEFPRHIALCNHDHYLLCANQKGNEVAIFELNKQSGMMKTKLGQIPFHTPSFVMEYE